MGVNLPNPRNVAYPAVPEDIVDPKVKEYLKQLVGILERSYSKAFDNTYAIVSTGTDGTFVASGGNTITVSSGIITGLT